MRLGKELAEMRELQEKIEASLRGAFIGASEQQRFESRRDTAIGA
jgi:hypothetical protein